MSTNTPPKPTKEQLLEAHATAHNTMLLAVGPNAHEHQRAHYCSMLVLQHLNSLPDTVSAPQANAPEATPEPTAAPRRRVAPPANPTTKE